MNMQRFKTANEPSLEKNQYIAGHAFCKFEGVPDETIGFLEGFQLTDAVLWRRFVEQFRTLPDSEDGGWRGEYWGKMMRGACFVYSYTQNKELYDVLTTTVNDLLESCEEDGRLSTYAREKEFTGWDIWCRKYALLGMQYYLEICKDSALAERIVNSLCQQADCIVNKIGPKEDGKLPITQAAALYRGLNSSSVLEPFVRLYNITKEERYLAFAEYIVNEGGISVGNIFRLAYENQFYPYQYPFTKAYEMVSCFEGLLEFYRVIGTEWYKEALIHFADKLLESDFTIIGSSGCTGELLDHSTVRQANTTNAEIMQETCVTVTLMKFFYQMTLLTGDAKYADAFERSYYNAYLGAVNTEKSIDSTIAQEYPDAIMEPLPFDSYSPLTAGIRGNGVGGLKLMSDNHYYGCCACIGSAGAGLFPKMAAMRSQDGIVINLYHAGKIGLNSPSGNPVSFDIDTKYPVDGSVKLQMTLEESEEFTVYLRNPAWSKKTVVKVNGAVAHSCEGYIQLKRNWANGDEIELLLDMRTEVIRPIPYGTDILMIGLLNQLDYMIPIYDVEDPRAKSHLAFRRGPLILAADSALGYDVEGAFEIEVSEDDYVDALISDAEMPYGNILALEIPLKSQGSMIMTDYASAGKKWSKTGKIAAWIQTK